MKRGNFTRDFYVVIVLIVGMFFALLSPTGALANDDDLLQKQQEIDKYVFETHAKEIADLGFQVTHTGQVDNYVEVGITPYNETNANYLYEIFGTEKVKVVQGEMAVTYTPQTAAATNANNPVVASSSYSSSIPFFFYSLVGIAVIGIVMILFKRRAAK